MPRGKRKSLLDLGVLSPAEVAEMFGMSVATVSKALRDGDMRGNQPAGSGGNWYIRKEDAIAWLLGDHKTR